LEYNNIKKNFKTRNPPPGIQNLGITRAQDVGAPLAPHKAVPGPTAVVLFV